jgi:GT2 family glycosyltransferase
VNRVQSKKDFWIFGCKIYFGHLNKVIQYAGGKLDRSGSGVLTGYFERDYGQYDQESEVDWVHGAAFAVRKNLFDKIGHFDPIYYPIYHDEIDLCYRARKSGYKVLYVPAAVAYHFENTSSERISKTAFYRIRNTLIFAFKYYPVLSLFLLPFLHAKSIANGLRTPKYKQMPKVRILSLINSYITATIWILRSLPLIMQDRYLERQQRNR